MNQKGCHPLKIIGYIGNDPQGKGKKRNNN